MNVQRFRLARAFSSQSPLTHPQVVPRERATRYLQVLFRGRHFFAQSNDEEEERFLVVVDVATDAIFVIRYLACTTNQSNVHFSANIELALK